MLKKCLNMKVLAGLAVVGVGIWLLAPELVTAAVPLLLLAACPLSMVGDDGDDGQGQHPAGRRRIRRAAAAGLARGAPRTGIWGHIRPEIPVRGSSGLTGVASPWLSGFEQLDDPPLAALLLHDL